MIFLANENFPGPSVSYLRSLGYNVLSVSERFSGVPDLDIIDIARTSNLIILTLDKDYGDLLLRRQVRNPPSVVFFRLPKETKPSDGPGRMLESLINDGTEVTGRFTVVTRKKLRQRIYEQA
jgi:predicted nuclease of predicted toxin-antitoxin system